MENFTLLNLIKALGGFGGEASGNNQQKNDAQNFNIGSDKNQIIADRHDDFAPQQNKPATSAESEKNKSEEKYNYMYAVLERHEKISNRIKNRR